MKKPLLNGKVALVTGSAKGLNAAIAIALAKQGAGVVVHYRRSEQEAKKTYQNIKRYNSSAFMVRGDVTNEKDVRSIIKAVERKFGRLDILVNGVGNFVSKPIRETTSEEFRDVIESNLYSVFYTTKHALPLMRRVKRGWHVRRAEKQKYGRIINFGNVSAQHLPTRPNTTPYIIAKAGVISLTRIIAAEEAKNGITVNTISPGILETSVVKLPVPIGRPASFDDIINVILFLLKTESNYITGANIEVSGGLTF